MPVETASGRPLDGVRPGRDAAPATGLAPTAIAVDLGSGQLRMWAAARGTVSTSIGEASMGRTPAVRRGRVLDGESCAARLTSLLRNLRPPTPAGSLVVVCRPVLATTADQEAVRRVLTAALAPRRLLFIDTVRAAAIGAGAAVGPLLIADIGAQLTEVAFLDDGHVRVARRVEVGTRDIIEGATNQMLADITVHLVRKLCQQPQARPSADAALARGMFVVGDGATRPDLIAHLAGALGIAMHVVDAPRTAAITGAGLAAMAAARHRTVG